MINFLSPVKLSSYFQQSGGKLKTLKEEICSFKLLADVSIRILGSSKATCS